MSAGSSGLQPPERRQAERREQEAGAALRRSPPALPWLRTYSARTLRADAVAGVTLAAYMIPAAIGDASLARLPVEAGLYACIFSGLVFWAFCSSRRTAITVTSAISLVVGTSLGSLAGGDPARFAALAACTALMVAALAFLAWLIRAGTLVRFVSETVMMGFKIGVALTLASTQIPKLLGVGAGHGNFWENTHQLLVGLHETNIASLVIGMTALTALIAGRFIFRNRPVALFVVIGGILASGIWHLEARGVKLLGEVPAGLPAIGLPAVGWSDINELLPLAMACFLLAAVETVAIGRMLDRREGPRFNANRELLALAGANLGAGVGRGFPVSGGLSQSLVNTSAGARTPVSGLFSVALMIIVAVFLSDGLRNLPQPVLAAVVLTAVLGLIDVRAIRDLWRSDRRELIIMVAALLGVLGSGLLRGVLIGVVISLVLLISKVSRPHVATLGRIPGTRRFSDMERHPDNEQTTGVLVLRPEGGLAYFNAEHVHEAVLARVGSAVPPVVRLVCDLGSVPLVDRAAATMIVDMARELRDNGVQLRLVEARASVRDRLRASGIEAVAGSLDRFTSVADAVDGPATDGSEGERSP